MTKASAVVYVVDDDVGVRTMLQRLVASVGMRVEAFASPQAFLEHDHRGEPCCLVLDVRFPGMSGLELQHELAKRNWALPIVFITGHGDIPMSVQAMKDGAADFLPKPFRDQDLLDAIHRALDLDRQSRRVAKELSALRRRLDSLTLREREVFVRVADGSLNKQIAGALGTTEQTIKVHRARVMDKMGAGSLPELVRMAERLRITDTIGERQLHQSSIVPPSGLTDSRK